MSNLVLAPLEELLSYKNDKVLSRFKRDHPHLEEKAEELFEELLKYLWIGQKHFLDKQETPNCSTLKFSMVMHEEMRDMDEIWHCFILFTRDYHKFCNKYFGCYIHHIPDMALNYDPVEEKFEENLQKYIYYVFDQLGELTIQKWFGLVI